MKNFNIFLLLLCGFWLGIVSILMANYVSNNVLATSVYNTNIANHEQTLTQTISDKLKWIDSNQNPYKKFDQIKYILDTQMYSASWIDTTGMINGALHGFVGGAGDDHTVYFDGEESSEFTKDLAWSQDFEWIGAYISQKWDAFVIQEMVKWSPAYQIWLKPDDVLIDISGQRIKTNMTSTDVVNLIRWPKWTSVKMTIYRPSTKAIMKFEIVRQKINISSVTSKVIDYKNKKIWYINISTIWEDTYNNFVINLQEIKKEWINWLILDLRWNGWGLVPVASEIMSNRVSTGTLLISAKYKAFPDESYYSSGYGLANGIPTVVLVDEITASASEMIAWWLNNTMWIKLIWTKTYGKWSIQTINSFDDGSSIKYTIGRRFLPNGKNIDKVWISPDINVEFDTDLYKKTWLDTQMQAWEDEIIKLLN